MTILKLMRTRFHENQFFLDNARRIITELKAASKENIQALARFSIWNSIFFDEPIIPDTKIRNHFNNILRRHLIGSTSPQRFLFELSIYMIDLPDLYLKLIDMFPVPYAIAGRIAYRTVINHIEKTSPDATEQLKSALYSFMPSPPQVVQELADSKGDKVATFEAYVNQIVNSVPHEVLEAIIRTFPPQQRLKYSIKYGCTPPKLDLDLSSLAMPFEFLQAIADIDGAEFASQLIDDTD